MVRKLSDRVSDLRRLASGIALVANESTQRMPALFKLRDGDIVGSTTETLKFVQNVLANVTGVTRGEVENCSTSYKVHDEKAGNLDQIISGSKENNQSTYASNSIPQAEEFRSPPCSTSSAAKYDHGIKREIKIELHGDTVHSEKGSVPPENANLPKGHDSSLPRSLPVTASKMERSAEEQKATTPSSNEAGSPLNTLPNVVRSVVKRRKSRERRVPSTSIGRALGFAGLGAGLAWGTFQESAKRLLGGQGNSPSGQSPRLPLITEQNAERIAVALCRMRGAALKVGQMLSIQDESLVPPQVLAALESVRQGADVMPRRQLKTVLDKELGSDWLGRLESFDFDPIAAASIGQVHRATLKDAGEVAMKIQYPGVADSIDSDIDNVRRLLNYTNLIPKGLYLDQAMKVAKEELARECDYEHEAKCQRRFKELLKEDSGFYVPAVVDEFCTKRVLTSELVSGVPIDRVALMNQDVRNSVGERLLRLTLQELFVFRFMQTDPNWGNFLYDEATDIINLIDFGAARDYPVEFVDNYLRMVLACASRDAAQVLEMSRRLGFLTGKESQLMRDAHMEAAFATGEPFANPGPFDFSATDIIRRVSSLGGLMIKERLTPPPDEAYSLHRKLSGAFLACVKLRAVVPCRKILVEFSKNYKFSDLQTESSN